MSKKILYFMPDNPLKKNAGNKIRALSFLQYFKSRGFHVHFVSEHFWGEWTDDDIKQFENSKLAQVTSILFRKPFKRNLLYYLFCYVIPNLFYQKKLGIIPSTFPELVTLRLKKAFNQILKQGEYDYIFINYASWSGLIERSPFKKNASTILDTHDFLTAQYQHKYPIGAAFQEEIRRLSLFDQVLAISVEEQYIFNQFCKAAVHLAPMAFKRPPKSGLPSEKRFDLIYVASNNPHNIRAANWFFNEVYSLLPQSISICIIGAIGAYISPDLNSNITRIAFADDLNIWYRQSKIAICPMLSGTGTKIKVIEALAHALPVVCNTRGIDGLLNKTNNGCLVSDDPQQFARHILTLLDHPDEYRRQSEMAAITFESAYEKEMCYKRLDEIFL